jgi:hypothetical protein
VCGSVLFDKPLVKSPDASVWMQTISFALESRNPKPFNSKLFNLNQILAKRAVILIPIFREKNLKNGISV